MNVVKFDTFLVLLNLPWSRKPFPISDYYNMIKNRKYHLDIKNVLTIKIRIKLKLFVKNKKLNVRNS